MKEQLKEKARIFLKRYRRESYAQEGEDLLLDRFLGEKKSGFYVDIGAHHPFRFSNTYRFYHRGWNGICIDANPESMKHFKKYRPRDICVEIGVSDQKGELEYFIFNEPALNTFSKKKADEVLETSGYKIVKSVKIPVETVGTILDRYLPANTVIDFLSIDIEGFDLQVLKSNDWKKYSPHFVLLEDHQMDLENLSTSEVHRYMREQGYQLVSKLYVSALYEKT